ncbi:Vesicle transport protein S20 [Coemansia interrupta]|uniref:Vesicle transport protein S20 n=1 Tax=Coemansia interrupta TaxID=1126814 RepID=A0A9W8HB54_9FUNG|nr:Vesicle transport protein S20 [Coemansia interrupta]
MATSHSQGKISEHMDSQLKQMQKLLDDLVVKTQKAEDDAISAGADENGSAKVADALKDMLKAEQAIDSLESKLDTLLGRLDNMIDDKEQQQNKETPEYEIQLRQLSSELDEVEKDISLLAEFSGSRDEHRQIADSIRDQLRGAERLVERLQVDIEDIQEPKLQKEVQGKLDEHTRRIQSLQRAFRTAVLRFRDNTASTARRERELLLSGAATPAELRKRKVRTGNAALNAASDLTTALQETVGMMNDEIEKSVGNITVMQDSSDLLQKTKAQYFTMDDVLKTSKDLIRALEQADAMDRWLMLGGLVLFAAVSFNIIRKRVWIPGLSTVLSILKYLLFAGGSGKSGNTTVTSAILSPIATTATQVLEDVSLALSTSSLTSVVVASVTTSLLSAIASESSVAVGESELQSTVTLELEMTIPEAKVSLASETDPTEHRELPVSEEATVSSVSPPSEEEVISKAKPKPKPKPKNQPRTYTLP